MVEVTVTVTPYPGATIALELEEWSPITRAWVDTGAPSLVTGSTYTATVTSAAHTLRARWEITAGGYSDWFAPTSVVERKTPTAEQQSQLKEAVIAKATRIFLQSPAALGYVGEMSELGMATVRPDYQIRELLVGLRWVDWDVDHTTLVTQDDVITQGLQATADGTWPTAKLDLIDEAIEAAWAWVAADIFGGVPVA